MSQLKGPPPAAALTRAAHRRLRYVQPEVHKLVSVKGSTTCSCSYQGTPQPAQTFAKGQLNGWESAKCIGSSNPFNRLRISDNGSGEI
jgi:hypothetical protein